MKSVMLFAAFFIVCLVIPDPGFCAMDDDVIADGDGFVLTRKDVMAIKNYYENSAFRTSGEEYQKAALKIKLFAREAVALHLDKDEDLSSSGKSLAEIDVILAGLYYKHIAKLYPVSDLVIESYYRTYPERFIKDMDHGSGMKLPSMDDDIKQKIRTAIVNIQKKKIISEAEDTLKAKYHVKVY